MAVTDFPHVQQMFTDAYARLVAMKLFALRAADYLRAASPDDRRYLLYNPIVKMKVTTQGEEVINLLWDVIAAKGFERDTYFEMAARDIRALPKLEGTVHVNIALIVKFMANYFFNPAEYPEISRAGPGGRRRLPLPPGAGARAGPDPVPRLSSRLRALRPAQRAPVRRSRWPSSSELLATATPDEAQQKDIDFLLALGEIFTLVVYAQLILENAAIYAVDDDLLDQIFDVFVRDFSRHALGLHCKPQQHAAADGALPAHAAQARRRPGALRARLEGAGLSPQGRVRDERVVATRWCIEGIARRDGCGTSSYACFRAPTGALWRSASEDCAWRTDPQSESIQAAPGWLCPGGGERLPSSGLSDGYCRSAVNAKMTS